MPSFGQVSKKPRDEPHLRVDRVLVLLVAGCLGVVLGNRGRSPLGQPGPSVQRPLNPQVGARAHLDRREYGKHAQGGLPVPVEASLAEGS